MYRDAPAANYFSGAGSLPLVSRCSQWCPRCLGMRTPAGIWFAINTLGSATIISKRSTEMSIASLEDLFIHELRDVLDAERQLVKALPKMAKAASDEELK